MTVRTWRQKMREEILSTTRRDFADFAEVMAELPETARYAALGGSAVEEAAARNGWTVRRVL